MPAVCSPVSNCIVWVCGCVCACMCVCVFLQSWVRSAVQWGVPSCWCPRSSSSSGSCVRRIWYVSPHPLHAPLSPPPHWHHPAQITLTGQARTHLLCIYYRHHIFAVTRRWKERAWLRGYLNADPRIYISSLKPRDLCFLCLLLKMSNSMLHYLSII